MPESMSQQPAANEPWTLRRSELVCPADSMKMMTSAAGSDADEVIFDLEDGCAPSRKVIARKTLIEALRSLDFKGKTRGFRTNGIRTKFFYRDLIEVVEAAGQQVDVVVVPKVADSADVILADRLLSQIEMNAGLPPGRIRLEVLIESAKGLVHVEQISTASPRLTAVIFGVADYAGDVGGAKAADAPYSLYQYPRARIVAAAKAAGIDAIDGVTLEFRNLEKCREEAQAAAQLGFDGKWAVHPAQLRIIHEAFTPTAQEVERAREIVELYRQADKSSGAGVIVYKDEMVDAATLPGERRKLAIAQKLGLA